MASARASIGPRHDGGAIGAGAELGGCLRLDLCLPDALEGVRLELRHHSNRRTLALARGELVVTAGHWSRGAVHYWVGDRVFRIGPGQCRRHRLGRRPAPAEGLSAPRPG